MSIHSSVLLHFIDNTRHPNMKQKKKYLPTEKKKEKRIPGCSGDAHSTQLLTKSKRSGDQNAQ